VLGLLAFALSTTAVIIGFTQAKEFVARRLRYVDAARSPLAPIVAGIGAALIAAPIVWLLPLVGAGSAIAFGLSVALGVAAGNKEIRRSRRRADRRGWRIAARHDAGAAIRFLAVLLVFLSAECGGRCSGSSERRHTPRRPRSDVRASTVQRVVDVHEDVVPIS
jgi:hypothetical protein